MWLLTRAKLRDGKKYYGAYPGGFPERARVLLGCSLNDAVLHVCGGMAKYYLYKRGYGPNDKTLDLDPMTDPDYLHDARNPLPLNDGQPWRGILLDPPYSEQDAGNYRCGKGVYPTPTLLMKNALDAVEVGCKAGILHYSLPRCPPNGRFVACVGVVCGFGNRIRAYSVFERITSNLG